jgi:hypothetical protein
VFKYQAEFIDALRDGRKMQKRVFDAIAQRHAHDFANGRAGLKLYEDLLSAVRDSGVSEAAQEFEKRFSPLLMTDQVRTTGMEGRRGRRWGWISALCLAAVIVGALVFGINVLKMTTAGPPTVTNVSVPVAEATEPASETMTAPRRQRRPKANRPLVDNQAAGSPLSGGEMAAYSSSKTGHIHHK